MLASVSPFLKRFSSLLCLLLLAGVVTGFLVSRVPASTVTLPLEVLGAEGHTVSVTVHVDDPARADSLYLKGHALGYTYAPNAPAGLDYDDKASFRVNGGAWVPIDNEHFNAFHPESRMWTPPLTGPIGGPFHTLRGMLPLAQTGALMRGANTIEFRFNGTEGHTSGYRVLDLDLRASRTAPSAIGQTQFVQDDPSSWRAPEGFENAAAAGEALWHRRGILNDGALHDAAIEASCADCHAESGRDLKYFNFSNKSIISRAQFHGLTQKQGKQLSAYIRSVNLDLPAGEDVGTCGGRPWNPPYQPGPGLEARPVDCWAAGAGVDWVLPDDDEMAAFILPNASTRAALENLGGVPESFAAFRDRVGGLGADLSWSNFKRTASPDKALPNSRLPLAMQLPTVFEWWPDVYPGDYFGVGQWHASESYRNLDAMHDQLSSAGTRQALIEETHTYRNDWKHKGFGDFFREHKIQPNPKNWPDDLSPPSYDNNENDPRTEIGRLSTQQWAAIKTWEVMTEYRLEDLTEETLEPNARGLDLKNWDRMWPLMGMMPFDVATHKQGEKNGSYPDIAPYPTAAQDTYFSNAWYQLAVMMQNGARQAEGTTGVDWNYVFAHINDQHEDYGRTHFWRYVQNLVTQMQTRASWGRNEDWQTPGWDWRNHPNWKSLKESTPVKYFYLYGFNETRVPRDQRVKVGENLLRGWYAESSRYDEEHWATLYNTERGFNVGPGDTFSVTGDCGDTYIDPNGGDFAHDLMKSLHALECNGSTAPVLSTVATWGENLLPGGDWERFMTADGGGGEDDGGEDDGGEDDGGEDDGGEDDGGEDDGGEDGDGDNGDGDNGDGGDGDGGDGDGGDESGVFAVNAGGAAFTGSDNVTYQSDDAFDGGQTSTTDDAISGTDADALYQSERYGNFSYAIPVADGTYEVTFQFAEIYWSAVGERIFDVEAEGSEVIGDLDLYAEAGDNAAHDVTRTVTVADGKLNLAFQTEENNAKLSALRVQATSEDGGGDGGGGDGGGGDGDGGEDDGGEDDGGEDDGGEQDMSVTLADLTGDVKSNAALLEWRTSSEQGNAGFYIEQKDEAGTWRTASPLVEGAGTTTEPQHYTHRVDSLDPGPHTFRLRQVGTSGDERVFTDRKVEVDILLTQAYELKGAYPNPFRRRATVAFAVRDAQAVTVGLYNALGQRVRVLHDGSVPAGETQKLTVRAGNLASGVYFVRIRGEAFEASCKLALVR